MMSVSFTELISALGYHFYDDGPWCGGCQRHFGLVRHRHTCARCQDSRCTACLSQGVCAKCLPEFLAEEERLQRAADAVQWVPKSYRGNRFGRVKSDAVRTESEWHREKADAERELRRQAAIGGFDAILSADFERDTWREGSGSYHPAGYGSEEGVHHYSVWRASGVFITGPGRAKSRAPDTGGE
jgi:hypothetical protein